MSTYFNLSWRAKTARGHMMPRRACIFPTFIVKFCSGVAMASKKTQCVID